jgi:hypothetical protein
MTVPTGTRTGSGTISYTVAPNTSTALRTATLSIAGRNVVVSQAGATPPSPPSGLRVVAK